MGKKRITSVGENQKKEKKSEEKKRAKRLIEIVPPKTTKSVKRLMAILFCARVIFQVKLKDTLL